MKNGNGKPKEIKFPQAEEPEKAGEPLSIPETMLGNAILEAVRQVTLTCITNQELKAEIEWLRKALLVLVKAVEEERTWSLYCQAGEEDLWDYIVLDETEKMIRKELSSHTKEDKVINNHYRYVLVHNNVIVEAYQT